MSAPFEVLMVGARKGNVPETTFRSFPDRCVCLSIADLLDCEQLKEMARFTHYKAQLEALCQDYSLYEPTSFMLTPDSYVDALKTNAGGASKRGKTTGGDKAEYIKKYQAAMCELKEFMGYKTTESDEIADNVQATNAE